MGAGCSRATSVDTPCIPKRAARGGLRWCNGTAKLKMPTSDSSEPRNGRHPHPIRSSSNPTFTRSTTVPSLKVAWKQKGRSIRTTSEEITTVSDTRPSRANYHFVRERLLKWTPSIYHCRLFCGGPVCKYCDPNSFPTDFQAVPGLFSAWVTDDILATSRPTTSAIKRFDLYNSLKAQKIVSVINLQRPCEHMHCGPPFPSRMEFSYDPEEFMKQEFFHYNFGWPDFGASTVTCLLDMVKVLEFALTQGKVAVHCHAGLGRTGVLICAYLMWSKNYTATEAIQLVRHKRPGSVQTSSQVDILVEFDDLLKDLRAVFDPNLTFEEYLKRQQLVLHGMEARLLKFIPQIVFVCCERLLELAGIKPQGSLTERLQELLRYDDHNQFLNHLSSGRYLASRDGRRESVDSQIRHRSYSNASTVALNLEKPKKIGRTLIRFSTSELIDPNRLPPLPSVIRCEKPSMIVRGVDEGSVTPSDLVQVENEGQLDREQSKRATGVVSGPNSEKWRCVFDSVLNAGCTTMEEISNLKEGLTEKSFSSRWDVLATETSIENVLFMLRDWFMSLKEPAISPDFAFEVSNGKKRDLPKVVKWTVLYCANVFNKISGNDQELRDRCARYLVECFTKQRSRNLEAENWFLATIECITEMRDGVVE